jgi:Mn-dependent DtxR family transcriptional regulator
MAVEIAEKDEYIWNYLLKHRTPVTAAKLAKYFIVSKTSTSGTLKKLADAGLLDVIKIGSTKFYRIKE